MKNCTCPETPPDIASKGSFVAAGCPVHDLHARMKELGRMGGTTVTEKAREARKANCLKASQKAAENRRARAILKKSTEH